ncbi:unnamed protein product [Brassica oleracea]
MFNRVDLATCSIYDVSMFCITPILTLYGVFECESINSFWK